jgi:hypothetical protein
VERIGAEGLTELAATGWRKSEDPEPVAPTSWPEDMRDDGWATPRRVVRTPHTVELTGVPYIHQVYDVPEWFDGHWACNAVTALMCLAYWRAIEPSPIEVPHPEPRPSNFARYVCEPYSVASRAFDIASPDPKGRPAMGGYGYIVRENWKDTKNFMADFVRHHGIESSVDWQPTLGKYTAEIDAAQPLVILHSITLAGHYVTGIGYLRGRRTVVTHDPYGDKNSREYPHIDGRRARYDLPGYNNGYQNLRIVHCFIYTRGPITTTAGGD